MKRISAGIITLTFLLAFFFLWLMYGKAVPKTDCLAIETYAVNDGFGYKILCDKETLINQPFIPAIEGNRPFANETDARRIAKQVKNRIRKGETPTINLDDLVQLGVKF